ncbi:MAG: M56 family metallopeptidase [Bacteroidetes bacterium]|nr:M56 family metallopeptidase [Bacteroidota bacterium]
METFIFYLIKSTLLLSLLIIFYRLTFKNETYFVLNRIFLLVSIVSSVLFFPFLQTVYTIPINNISQATTLQEIALNPIVISAKENSVINWLLIIISIYVVVVAILFIRLLIQIMQIIRLYLKSASNRAISNHIYTDDHPSFSFFNLIFINLKCNLSDIEKIIAHEQVHVKQCHTIDILLVEVVCILHWFNPIVWWYRTSIREVHEYIADQSVINLGYEKQGYQSLLLSVATGVKLLTPENNFNSLIKKRIIMMTKSKSQGISLAKYLLIIPMFILLCLFPSLKAEKAFIIVKNGIDSKKINTLFTPVASTKSNFVLNRLQQKPKAKNAQKEVYTVVEIVPEFIGGQEAMMKHIIDNVKYPQEAKEKGIEGTVYVSFVVEINGEVSDVKVIRSANPLLDDEAIRVVKMMTNKWKAGMQNGKVVRVQFNLPIKFTLDKENEKLKK